MFESLKPKPADAILALISAFKADQRTGKIDLGVGVYRDEQGRTPVFAAVKQAERILLDEQPSKSYLGIEGDPVFVDLLRPIVFGQRIPQDDIVGFQTPGGSGALRLGADLIAAARPQAQIWLGLPSWPNHAPIFQAAGLTVRDYAFADLTTQTLSFEAMMAALSSAQAGDVVLLHGCCHNPTGLDLDAAQWGAVTALCLERGLIPFVDLAYQGLGETLDLDAAGARRIVEACPEVLVSYSCDKNFGLYRERTGALYVKSRTPGTVASNMAAAARVSWSMPPDHGAAVVRAILESEALTANWRGELSGMAERIHSVRSALAALHPALAGIARQRGLFSTLKLTREQAQALRSEHAVYLVPSGRINLAGLRSEDAPRFVEALIAVGVLARP
ncbi:amino acid aminotransferase [Bosea vestrisii]|uniref:amino acid aminotransferase n=1 Tax=Bosea vestrisii TaxID=151416 RepID=UPI0024DFECF9|nr:amino acid aminotransferase [Bosea vestrisii]WID98125.1 amino acid aminotransferase [Bosea vestrisii]